MRRLLAVFESTFAFFDLEVIGYRHVPIDSSVLGEEGLATRSAFLQAILHRHRTR